MSFGNLPVVNINWRIWGTNTQTSYSIRNRGRVNFSRTCISQMQSLLFSLQKRLQKELQAILKDPPAGIKVDGEKIGRHLNEYAKI